ncbi:MAG: histidine kinase [Alphaproteobacteria bacterium]
MAAGRDWGQSLAEVSNAAELRRRVDELREARRRDNAAERRRRAEARAAVVRAFLDQHITEEDFARARAYIHAAVENGQYEVEVLRFPADALTDGGRAVNNADPEWPRTLRGPAAEWYEAFQRSAAPNGFKMHARVMNFPDGKPGEVGLFLSWA